MYYYITIDNTGLITSRCATYEKVKGAIQLSQSHYNNGLLYTYYDKTTGKFYNPKEMDISQQDDITLVIELLMEVHEQLFDIQGRLDTLES